MNSSPLYCRIERRRNAIEDCAFTCTTKPIPRLQVRQNGRHLEINRECEWDYILIGANRPVQSRPGARWNLANAEWTTIAGGTPSARQIDHCRSTPDGVHGVLSTPRRYPPRPRKRGECRQDYIRWFESGRALAARYSMAEMSCPFRRRADC